MLTKAGTGSAKVKSQSTFKAPSWPWAPDRGDILWIDCNPQAGREMRDMHPMAVLSSKAFNARTGIVIGFPMTSSISNEGNPFALDVSRGAQRGAVLYCVIGQNRSTGGNVASHRTRGRNLRVASLPPPATG